MTSFTLNVQGRQPVSGKLDLPAPNADGWRRYWVKPDWESAAWGFRVRDAAPAPAINRIGEKAKTDNHVKTPFTRELQFFWADIVSMHLYGMLFQDLFEPQRDYVASRINALMGPKLAFFNRSVDERVAYFLTNENIDAALPRFAPLICAGCTVWGIPEGEVVKIASFLASVPLPPVTQDTLLDPRVLWATIIDPDKHVSPFPQLDGESVPYPLVTVAPYYFPLQGLQEYSFSVPFKSQYIPPREYYP